MLLEGISFTLAFPRVGCLKLSEPVLDFEMPKLDLGEFAAGNPFGRLRPLLPGL